MKKLTQHLKQALTALAAVDAGEMLTRRQMTRVLHVRGGTAAQPRRQVALWAGASVSRAALDYALSACKRLDAGLHVLHAQGADTARLRKTLGNDAIPFVALTGRPEAALRQFLATHAQVAFLVLDGDDHAAHFLAQRAGNPGVPIVVVTGERAGSAARTPHHSMPVAALG
jgi:hypothetical protein